MPSGGIVLEALLRVHQFESAYLTATGTSSHHSTGFIDENSMFYVVTRSTFRLAAFPVLVEHFCGQLASPASLRKVSLMCRRENGEEEPSLFS